MRMRASWFGSSWPTGYKVAARSDRARQRAPLDIVIPTITSVPPCSELSRCGLAMLELGERPGSRPTLTAPARDSVLELWVGTKKRAFRSNKETGMKCKKEKENAVNLALDFHGPIQGQALAGARSARP